jgi:hypothetical protein
MQVSEYTHFYSTWHKEIPSLCPTCILAYEQMIGLIVDVGLLECNTVWACHLNGTTQMTNIDIFTAISTSNLIFGLVLWLFNNISQLQSLYSIEWGRKMWKVGT